MTTLRTCIGSARFGIGAHEAPVEAFPKQPSQRDGLGRMCAVHWKQYTAGLARDAKARKTAAGAPDTPAVVEAEQPAAGATESERAQSPSRRTKRPSASQPVAEAQDAATR